MSPEGETTLKQHIVPHVNKSPDARIQILAFASSTDGTESSARRISLARALTVRDYLLKQNVNPSRIDVRALANQSGTTYPDRVDVILLKP